MSILNNSISSNINVAGAVIDFEKYKSLELRLMGCMRTIKTLERENQAKQDKISSLTLELEKKTKQIDSASQEKISLAQA